MARKERTPLPQDTKYNLHHYGMILGGIVAVVAVVAVVLLISGELTGRVVGMYNVPENTCTHQCGKGYVGQPIGHQGMNGYVYCLCKKA